MHPVSDISVVIPAYGASPHLATCLEALEGQTLYPREVIVFHSGPDDPGPDLAPRFPEVRFFHEDERQYAGGARNRGAAQAQGSMIACLDCDMEPTPGWLAAFAGAAEAGPEGLWVGAIGRQHTGGIWSWPMWLIECGSVLPHRRPHDLQSAPGANFALPAGLWTSSGGFREDLYAAEDGELSVRLREAGHPLRFVPGAVADHAFGGGAGHSLRRLRELGRAAAALRRHRDLPGAAAVRHPVLALAFPPVRLAQMLWRIIAEGGPLLAYLVTSPLIFAGLVSWTSGFVSEARRSTYPDLSAPGPHP